MTKVKYSECMALLQSIFGKIDNEKWLAYYSILSHMTDSCFEKATHNLIKNFKPTSTVQFPVPANFSEAIGITAAAKAQEYMTLIQKAVYSIGSYRSVDFGSRAVHSVIERYGGWGEICSWNQENWKIFEGRFLKALESAIDQDICGSDYLKGTIETTNGDIKYAQLSHVYKHIDGTIKIAVGLHPNTKMLSNNNNNQLQIVNDLVKKISER